MMSKNFTIKTYNSKMETQVIDFYGEVLVGMNCA
jgi:hypothetical protein